MAPLSQPSAHYSSPSPSSSRPSSSSSASATMNRASSIDPTLLTPVRSKRTPIACTECRRRQVKCSGETPSCARCKQKGSKCEYIPCSQQRAQQSSAAPAAGPVSSQNPSVARSTAGHSRSPSLSLEYPSPQWQQQPVRNQQYVLDSSPYPSTIDWRSQSSALNGASLAQQRGLSQAALSSQSYGDMSYGDGLQSQSSYGLGHSVRSDGLYTQSSYTQSHRDRLAAQSGYSHSDFSLGLSNMSPGYAGVDHSASQINASSSHHHAGYPNTYYQTDDNIFMNHSSGMVSTGTEQGWVSSMASYQGHHYA